MALARLSESKEDKLAKPRDAKAILQATVNSLNEQLAKAEAKKKEELNLIQGQPKLVETSHRTLLARKDAELDQNNKQIRDLEPFKQQVGQLKDEINTLRASANPPSGCPGLVS